MHEDNCRHRSYRRLMLSIATVALTIVAIDKATTNAFEKEDASTRSMYVTTQTMPREVDVIKATVEETLIKETTKSDEVIDTFRTLEFKEVNAYYPMQFTTINIVDIESASVEESEFELKELSSKTKTKESNEVKKTKTSTLHNADEPLPPVATTPEGFEYYEYIYSESEEDWPDEYFYYRGEILDSEKGKIRGPMAVETYYNLPMEGVIELMVYEGFSYDYWVRDDGVKMYGDYVIVAADLEVYPKGSIVKTSLGLGIVCDTGGFIENELKPTQFDIAVNW